MRGAWLVIAIGCGAPITTEKRATHWLLPEPAPETNGEELEQHGFVVSKAAPTPPRDPFKGMPVTHVALAEGNTLRIVRVAAAGVVVEREVRVPAQITGVTWSRGGLAVALAKPHAFGLVTQNGFEPITEPIPSDRDETHQLTWFDLPPDFDADLHQEQGEVDFESHHAYVPPTLRCNDRGVRSELTDKVLGGGHITDLSWVSASPVLLRLGGEEHDVILERCVVSKRYTGFVARSDGFVAVTGRESAVIWRGTQVGVIAFGAVAAAWEPVDPHVTVPLPPDHPACTDRRLHRYDERRDRSKRYPKDPFGYGCP